MPDRTILDLYRHDLDAPRSRHYSHWTPTGQRSLSTEDFFDFTAALADALTELGVERGDRVLLLTDNRPEWHIVDLAVLDVGAVDVPVYATLTVDQIAHQAADSGAVAAFAETRQQMEKLLAIRSRCPNLRHLIQIDGPCDDGVMAYDDLLTSADVGTAGSHFWERARAIEPDHLATIIYTSGTTGRPKGVMLTHDNLVQNVLHSAHRVPVRREDLALEFLPLCHVFERMISYIYMYRTTSKAYCSIEHVGELIREVRPTIMAAVPRFFEKVRNAVLERAAAAPAVRRALFRWALEIGRQTAAKRNAGRAIDRVLARRHRLADRLILAEIREGLGGRIRYCISGGAELALEINEFFHAIGIPVIEGYGLTETAPVIAVNGADPGNLRLGTVGKPLDNLEVAIASDGELLVRGPSVMKGYWNDAKATAEVLDADGFLHTGDIAEIDDDGFILVLDRKKDIIVTAGGKNISPQPIEARLAKLPGIDAAVLVGDRRPYLVALISPNFEDLERWARVNNVEFASREDLVELRVVRDRYQELITAVNASLARYEQIKKFAVLSRPLTAEEGDLTPTLKVKRRFVEERFSHLIDGLYRERARA